MITFLESQIDERKLCATLRDPCSTPHRVHQQHGRHAEQRGKGIGRTLVDAAMGWGRARGATALELVVWEFNQAALAFYERLGLATIHRTMRLEL